VTVDRAGLSLFRSAASQSSEWRILCIGARSDAGASPYLGYAARSWPRRSLWRCSGVVSESSVQPLLSLRSDPLVLLTFV